MELNVEQLAGRRALHQSYFSAAALFEWKIKILLDVIMKLL